MLFKNLNAAPPFQLFESYYVKAEENGQPHVEAGCVSSVDADGQPHARYVNFKYFFVLVNLYCVSDSQFGVV